MQRPQLFFAVASLALPLAFPSGPASENFSTLTVEIGEASSTELAITDAAEEPPVSGIPQQVLPERSGAIVDQ
jgi:hypothetical protein